MASTAAAALIAVVLAGLASGLALGSPQRGAHAKSCGGPKSALGFFALKGKVSAKKVGCATATRVVKGFPDSCSKAYAAQGKCTIRARGKWRCRSKITGSYSEGAPSKESCSRKKARVRFTVVSAPPTEPNVAPGAPAAVGRTPAAKSPYDPARRCVDTSQAGTLIPPPNPQSLGNFEIHVLSPVNASVGTKVQEALVGNQVTAKLNAGLASQTRNNPNRIPIYITPDKVDSANATTTGVTAPTCANGSVDGIVITTRLQGQPPRQLEKNAAHELFHAYAFWGLAVAGGASFSSVPWYEDASAEWSVQKVGLPDASERDIAMQYPNIALDSTDNGHNYAMWRFVQWLDDHGYIGEPAWPLERDVIKGYAIPGTTLALSQAIPKYNSSSSLGQELAAFWGDRLKKKPLRGPQLKPVAGNSNQIEITSGTSTVPAIADSLHTKLFDFKLAKNVARVEFEFDAPENGYFWGGVSPDESQRFRTGDSETFCVGGGDDGELKWPGHFPVTFTNGSLNTGQIRGEITVHAQTDPDLCQAPTPDNRACKLLKQANVRGVLGGGLFPFQGQSRDAEHAIWICFYHGDGGEIQFNLVRNFKKTAKQVRKGVKGQIDQLNLQPLKGVGSIAGIGTKNDGQNDYEIVVFAVAKENALFTLGPGAQKQNATTLAKRLAGEL